MASPNLGDKGLAVFTFAAYHQLTSGERVMDVVLRDGAGHRADPEAIREVESLGLATIEKDRAVFTEAGQTFLGVVLQALRGTLKHAEKPSAVA